MAKSGHPNFVYQISSPWREEPHVWSITGNHSGSSFDAADAESFMLGPASPMAVSYGHFLGTCGDSGATTYEQFAHQVVAAIYYDGQHSAPVWEEHFGNENPAPTTLLPQGDAYSIRSPENQPYTSLESCATLVAQVGLNSKNKPIFAKKYIHGLPSLASVVTVGGGVTLPLSSAGVTALEAQSNGQWFGSRVYVTPSGRQPLAAAWTAIPGQHQMPRGRKKKGTMVNPNFLQQVFNAFENGSVTFAENAAAAA